MSASPTIQEWLEEGKSVPDTVCTLCPLAMWRREGNLACYCRLMHHDTFDPKLPQQRVQRCDGPFLADDAASPSE